MKRLDQAFILGTKNPYDIARWCFPGRPVRTALVNASLKTGRFIGRLPMALNVVRSFNFSGWKPETVERNNSSFDSWSGWIKWDEFPPPSGILISVLTRWKINDTAKLQRGIPRALDTMHLAYYAEDFDGWTDSHILWWKLTGIGREQLNILADAKKRAGIE